MLLIIVFGLTLGVLGVWFVYRMVWGLGGFYTHVRYIPTPENLIRDEASSPLDIDGLPGQRSYWVELTMDELIAFHQRALPEAGWQIVAEGVAPSKALRLYCIIAEQRGVRAYIRIAQGATPEISAAFISINIHNGQCRHLLE